MNKKQAKLLRYYEKYTGNLAQAHKIRKVFDQADHKTKGKITNWLKHMVVMAMAVEQANEKKVAHMIMDQLKDLPTLEEGLNNADSH